MPTRDPFPVKPPDPIGESMFVIIVAGTIGAFSYACYAIAYEVFVMPTLRPPGTPGLSYGQQAGLLMMPLAAFLGCSGGAAFEVRRWWASAASISFPAIVAASVSALWKSSLDAYGPDPSDFVLYRPLLVGCAVCIPLNVALAIVGHRWHTVRRVDKQ